MPLLYEKSPLFHDREKVYRGMWEYCDRNGCLLTTQRDLAEPLGICYQAVCDIMGEFIGMGMVAKEGRTFRLIYKPEEIPWGEKFDEHRRKFRESVLRSQNAD